MSIEYLLHMIRMTFNGLLYAWPITLILLGAVIAALAHHSAFTQRDHDRSYLVILLPCALTVLILVCNASSAGLVVIFLVLAHLPVTAFLARRFLEYQSLVLTVGAFQMWVSMVAAFMGVAYGFLLYGNSID